MQLAISERQSLKASQSERVYDERVKTCTDILREPKKTSANWRID